MLFFQLSTTSPFFNHLLFVFLKFITRIPHPKRSMKCHWYRTICGFLTNIFPFFFF